MLEKVNRIYKCLVKSQPSDLQNHLLKVIQAAIKNHKTNITQTWSLVSENEIDTKNGKISFNSPIGSALIGHKVGEIVEVNVPSGVVKLEILSIK